MKEYVCAVLLLLYALSSESVLAGREVRQPYPAHRDVRYNGPVPAASQQVSQVVAGYHYPVPAASTNVNPQIQAPPKKPVEVVVKEKSLAVTTVPTTTRPKPKLQQVPASSVKQLATVVAQASSVTSTVEGAQGLESSAAAQDGARLLHAHHTAQIQTIDVACGKEKMTVRVTFDQNFNGVIYAKGHYSDPNCRFTAPNQGLRTYQFEMVVGQCGVAFIDSGLTTGGQAYVEGMIVVILEPGVQEAWDSARRIRCLWEGNIDQTVTFPLSINMLESQTLTFSGDTASASLEIQNGRGPRAAAVQGLVRVGELLTAVVTVQGDPDFDLVVKNCIATDGTPQNRIILSDNKGCAVKPKLMGGWQKQRNSGSIAAYSYLSAFKFPDIMDLFLECTVSLCKGTCEECPEYLELHVPSHDHDEPASSSGTSNSPQQQPQSSNKIDVRTAARVVKRSVQERYNDRYNETVPSESLRLRRVLHIISPDDLPELLGFQETRTSSGCANECFSVLGIVAAMTVPLALMLISLAIFAVTRRQLRNEKC